MRRDVENAKGASTHEIKKKWVANLARYIRTIKKKKALNQ